MITVVLITVNDYEQNAAYGSMLGLMTHKSSDMMPDISDSQKVERNFPPNIRVMGNLYDVRGSTSLCSALSLTLLKDARRTHRARDTHCG